MKVRGLHLLLIIIISALLGYFVGVSKVSFTWSNYRPSVNISNREAPAARQIDFSLFWTVLSKIEDNYYDKKAIDTTKIVNGAIAGMVQSLGDPYTLYLPPTQNDDFKEGMAGQAFEGIGAELGMSDKQIIVVAPLDDNPAIKAGIRPGDAILKVNDQDTFGWTLQQTVDKIRGPRGTKVTLTILHKGSNKPQDISITREAIKVKSVTTWVKQLKDIDQISDAKLKEGNSEKSIAYLRISQFGDNTNQEWVAAVNKMLLENQKEKDFAGIVLDLRNNPGGYLTDATYIASEFIPDGNVVLQEKGTGEKMTFPVVRKGQLLDVPVVVLINKGSASASEIVAGAIRDHQRGQLVGETSFGKGTIQEAEDLGNGAGLHVTIAKWLTPNGIWVHGKGLKPDVSVVYKENDKQQDNQLTKAIETLLQQ
ncbi:MAG: S41 family peptidase [Candidatus Levybacteria bacterium]|nr:S41 family peptidase [Candidatus Levybacteria bacterium]